MIGRVLISCGVIAALLSAGVHLPHADPATLALLLVLADVGLAKTVGRTGALAGAVFGAAGFGWFFLPPPGLRSERPEHLVALGALLITGVVIIELSVTSERGRVEAVRRHEVIEKLASLVNALLEKSGDESAMEHLVRRLAEIFEADAVALYETNTHRIVRAGPRGDTIPEDALVPTSTEEIWLLAPVSGFSLIPIFHGGEQVGTLAMSGGPWPQDLIDGIAGRLGLGLAKMYALEKTTEAEVLRRSEELKSAVLDAMAHDIRNPLNSVKLAATTLLTGNLGEASKREMLQIISEEVNRMDRVIDDAARLARADAGELSLHTEACDLVRLIPDAIAKIGEPARRRHIRICLPDALAPAECDRGMITSVLSQLIGNALKYSPDGSPLTISGQRRGERVVIDVVDSGPGVDIDERERIFEKYYRGRTAAQGTKGTGLGLASARSIVQAHGGEIWVTSPPSGGAAFHFSLPAAGSGVEAVV